MADHPKFSPEPYYRCYAFGKNHRRCRLERAPNTKTCHIHRNYYYNWFVEQAPFYLWENLSKRQQREWLFQLTEGHLIVPESHIRQLNSSYREYFIFLAQHRAINPLWNIELLRSIVQSCIHRAMWPTNYAGVATGNTISHLLTSPEVCEEVFTMMLHYICYFASSPNLPLSEELISRVFIELFSSIPEWMQVFKSSAIDKCLTSMRDFLQTNTANALAPDGEDRNTMRAISAVIIARTVVESTFAAKRLILQKAASSLKEELVVRVFAPERVAKWIEAGLLAEDM